MIHPYNKECCCVECCHARESKEPATPPQEKGELTQLRIKLENAETVIEDIASDVAEFAADGDSPNAGPRDRLAAKVFSHISAHRKSDSDVDLSWKDKQLAGLEESLRAAKERMLKDEAENTRLREENASMRTAIKEGHTALEKALLVHKAITTYAKQSAEDFAVNMEHCGVLAEALATLSPFTSSK
jgi:hypothetical protein